MWIDLIVKDICQWLLCTPCLSTVSVLFIDPCVSEQCKNTHPNIWIQEYALLQP